LRMTLAIASIASRMPVRLAFSLARYCKRHVFRRFRQRDRQFRRDLLPPRALGDRRRLQGGDVVGKGLGSGIRAT
jgi:hypothetical protein